MSQPILPYPYELLKPHFIGKNSTVYIVLNKKYNERYFAKSPVFHTNSYKDLNQKRKFKHEIDLISRFDHPHIAKLKDSYFHEDNYLLLFDYANGSTLSDFISQQIKFSVTESTHLFIQLLSALEYIHHREVIHCDINPNNIFISDDRKKLEIFDFGLSKNIADTYSDKGKQFIGTPPYLSPEQTGLTEFKIDTRTDLFCAGLIFYQLLSGKLPFQLKSKTIQEIFKTTTNFIFEEIPFINKRLNQILKKSLNINPNDRYQSAAQLINDLRKIDKSNSNNSIKTRPETLDFNKNHTFIGRNNDLILLMNQFHLLKRGIGSSLLFYGGSGVGKSHLIKHFFTENKIQNVIVKCNRFSLKQPLSVYKELILNLIDFLQKDSPDTELKLKTQLTRYSQNYYDILKNFFPEIIPLIGKTSTIPNQPKEIEQEQIEFALTQLFIQLIEIKNICVLIDDIQWMDNQSEKFIRDLINGRHKTCIILTLRTGQDNKIDNFPSIKKIKFDHKTLINPFSLTEIEMYIKNRFDLPQIQKLSNLIHDSTDRHPLTISESIDILIKNSIIYDKGTSWDLNLELLNNDVPKLDANSIFLEKFGSFSNKHKHVLDIASCQQGFIDFSPIKAICRLPKEELEDYIKFFEDKNFIHKKERNKYTFYHDKIQETIFNALNENKKKMISTTNWPCTMKKELMKILKMYS